MATTDSHSALAKASLSGFKWNYLGTVVRTVAGLAVGVVLARILGPEPFGEIAVATLVIGLANLIADLGLGAALIQRESISDDDIRFIFTMQVLLGLALSCSVAVAAGALGAAFHSAHVAPVIRALSPIFTLQAFGQTATSLLKRDLGFRSIQLAQVVSYLVAYLGLGIPLALVSAGVWSLVGAQLSQTVLYVALVYLRARHPVRPLIRTNGDSYVWFGGKVVATNLANWTISNVDNVLVGRMFGVAVLGLYNRAFLLTATPMNAIVMSLQSVLFSASSRVQHDRPALRKGFLTSLSLVGLATVPVFWTAAIVPSTVIEGLYGRQWVAAAALFRPLALAMPFHALMALGGPMLWGLGAVERELKPQLVVASCTVVSLALASRVSVEVLAWVVLAMYIFRFVLIARAAARALDITGYTLGRVIFGPAVIGIAIAGLVLMVDRLGLALGVGPTPRLVGDAVAGLVSLIGAVVAAPTVMLTQETREGLQWFVERLPRPLGAPILARLGGW